MTHVQGTSCVVSGYLVINALTTVLPLQGCCSCVCRYPQLHKHKERSRQCMSSGEQSTSARPAAATPCGQLQRQEVHTCARYRCSSDRYARRRMPRSFLSTVNFSSAGIFRRSSSMYLAGYKHTD
jgi:hypothetical protein